jgi:HEPN domain-containing protein/predicted nucleotidyltransferase
LKVENVERDDLVRYLRQALTDQAVGDKIKIEGAILFGSWSLGIQTPASDIDVLIVARSIHSKRHRRGEDIASISRAVAGLPLDVLLLTKEEVISNFRNHNPLFLDIAEEGSVLLDETGLLSGLMYETREYIRERGIKRYGDGWQFPVKKGAAAYLSKVSNEDFSRAMLRDGTRDFEIGERLVADCYYDKAVYHFQQAVEKAVKSVLISRGIFQKTHFVSSVLRSILSEGPASDLDSLLSELADIAETIEPEVSLSRYPGIINDRLWLPYDEYQRVDAEKAMRGASKALEISRRFVADWFSRPDR